MAIKLRYQEEPIERDEDERDLDRIIAHHHRLTAAEASLKRLIEEAASEVEAEQQKMADAD